MIRVSTLQKCLRQLPILIRERAATLTASDIAKMVEEASFFVTPEVRNILKPNIHLQVNCGNMYHFVFYFTGYAGEFYHAEQFIGSAWRDVTALPQAG